MEEALEVEGPFPRHCDVPGEEEEGEQQGEAAVNLLIWTQTLLAGAGACFSWK